MAILTIKNVPDGLYRRLRARAKRQRRSLSQEVVQILQLPAVPGLEILQLKRYA